MKIGLISDTHDRLESFDAALQYFAAHNITTVFHVGDWKSVSSLTWAGLRLRELGLFMYGVLGNNDLDVSGFKTEAKYFKDVLDIQEGVLRMEIDGLAIAMYHGHHAPTLKQLRLDSSTDILLLGHTHKPKIEYEGKTLVVNPGSTAFSIPRSRDFQPSIGVVDLKNMKEEIIYI